MKNKIYRALIILIIGFLPITGWSVEKKAQVGFRFLENPISAEAIAMGGMGVLGIENANTVFWNPSGLGWLSNKTDMTANFTKGIADINYGAFAGAFRLGNSSMLAVDMTFMDYGEFNGTIRADNETGFTETGTFIPTAYAIGLSYAQRVSDRFAYGVRLKYAYQNLGSVTVSTSGTDVDDSLLVTDEIMLNHGEPAIDIGATYKFADSGIRFGAVIQNVSREVTYVREAFPLPFSVSFSLNADVLRLLNKDNDLHKVIVGIESTHPRDYKEKVKFGIEYCYLNTFFIRAGYRVNYDQRGLTFGLGLNKKIGNTSLRFDYSYETYGVFNGVNTFTIGSAF